MAKANPKNDKFFLKKVRQGILKVTKSGKVFNLKTGNRIGSKTKKGYIQIGMKHNGKVKHIFVHRLVYLVYGKNILSEDLVINHKDGNKENNRISNLEAVTESRNRKHAWENGLVVYTKEMYKSVKKSRTKLRGGLSTQSKLSNNQAKIIRKKYGTGKYTQMELATMYGVSRETIKGIINFYCYIDA